MTNRHRARICPGLGEITVRDLLKCVSGTYLNCCPGLRETRNDQLEPHKTDHERLLDELRDLMDEEPNQPVEAAERLARTLKAWFADYFRLHDAHLHRSPGPNPRAPLA